MADHDNHVQLEFFAGPLDGHEQWVPACLFECGQRLRFRHPCVAHKPIVCLENTIIYHNYEADQPYDHQGRLTMGYVGWTLSINEVT